MLSRAFIPRSYSPVAVSALVVCLMLTCNAESLAQPLEQLASTFISPPPSARPWVYWFWMDGNSSRDGITADFEAMQQAGIGGVYQMEVDVGIPRGPVAFMSAPWRDLFKHAVTEADRLGLQITVNAGPGWTGSGGPWVSPAQSMQKLVYSDVQVTGGRTLNVPLPQPPTTAGYYRDVAVLAFPTPSDHCRIRDIEQKALYQRGHYSSESGVRSYLPEPAVDDSITSADVIPASSIVDLTSNMNISGVLTWAAPPGDWTIMRFGHTSTGANTRPAPKAGLGLECDKMDAKALAAHYASYMQPLIDRAGPLAGKSLANLHIDSWEMHSENWTANFPQEFLRRRGYSILPWLPVFSGCVIDSVETSERFLWDLRRTCEEMIVENHAQALKQLGAKSGMHLSIEPYDGTPISDMRLGSVADIPMCEFWANCFQTWFSCYEATSIAHTLGRDIVAAEAFTSNDEERWLMYPGSMKGLGDWAFCRGINRFAFHRYAHQPWLDRAPGMTMGPYGIHFERTQTWWPLVDEYNRYIARCQAVLQQGTAVADVLYLAPEDSPFVFHPPDDAVTGNPPVPRTFHFDCCTADTLLHHAYIETATGHPRIAFDHASSYAILVLPNRKAISPQLMQKIEQLANAGAVIIGNAPSRSLGLSNRNESDAMVQQIASKLWNGKRSSATSGEIAYGKGAVVPVPNASPSAAQLPPLSELWSDAEWIWSPDQPDAAHKVPAGQRVFAIQLPHFPGAITSARLVSTADNSLTAYVNGTPVGDHRDFRNAANFDITRYLTADDNLLTVSVTNSGEKPNPAGFIGCVYLQFDDATSATIPTNRYWLAGETEPTLSALELGPYTMPPWGAISEPFSEAPLYPAATLIDATLRQHNVTPDIQTSLPLDYIHRRTASADIYFLRNTSDAPCSGTCCFAVPASGAQVWNPVTSAIDPADITRQSTADTELFLNLEPRASRFIVFGTTTTMPAKVEPPTTSTHTLLQLAGPWKVQFQPKRGAPESIVLPALVDLARHSDPAVQHFSGLTTYTTTFTLPAQDVTSGTALQLDLGKVAVIAHPILNGHALRTLWCAPYNIDITAAAHAGENTLSLEVANLWPNRLIGDAALPENQRIASTTWNPFRPEDPLPPSGLIGPVTIQSTHSSPP